MSDETDFKSEFIELVPALRAFARSLSGNRALADDLTQETLLRAWGSRTSFTPGTNMRAWLFTILRNVFYSHIRQKVREIEDPDGINAATLAVAPAQMNGLEIQDLQAGLSRLPDEQREAIILVGATGCSYEEAASICGCAIGTIKSRVSRARKALLLYLDNGDEIDGKIALSISPRQNKHQKKDLEWRQSGVRFDAD